MTPRTHIIRQGHSVHFVYLHGRGLYAGALPTAIVEVINPNPDSDQLAGVRRALSRSLHRSLPTVRRDEPHLAKFITQVEHSDDVLNFRFDDSAWQCRERLILDARHAHLNASSLVGRRGWLLDYHGLAFNNLDAVESKAGAPLGNQRGFGVVGCDHHRDYVSPVITRRIPAVGPGAPTRKYVELRCPRDKRMLRVAQGDAQVGGAINGTPFKVADGNLPPTPEPKREGAQTGDVGRRCGIKVKQPEVEIPFAIPNGLGTRDFHRRVVERTVCREFIPNVVRHCSVLDEKQGDQGSLQRSVRRHVTYDCPLTVDGLIGCAAATA